MEIKVLWTCRDWAEAVAAMPVQGLLPCRTVLVPRPSVAHVLRRELIRAGRGGALAGTRFLAMPLAAVGVLRAAGVAFRPGEETLRPARLSALFRTNRSLGHFPLELLRTKAGWDEAFSRTVSDLEAAGLRPEDLESRDGSARVRDVVAIWRALDESAGLSRTPQRILVEAAAALERCPEAWPFQGGTLAFACSEISAAEARFLRAIPQATIGLAAARPVRRRYLERVKALLSSEAADALAQAQAPRVAKTERDLLASYLFEPPAILAEPARPRSRGPDGTVDLEEHAGVEADLEATADWVARQVTDGTPLEEIAVLVPDPDPLAGLVAASLARLPWHDGLLPVCVAGGLPLTAFTSGARALAVVRALRAHLAAETLADVLMALRLVDAEDRHLSHGAAMELVWSLGTTGGNPARPEGALEWSARAAAREADLDKRLSEARAAEETNLARKLERGLADLRAARPALDALVEIASSVIGSASLSVLWPSLRTFLDERLLQPRHDPQVHILLDERLSEMALDSVCGSLAGDDALAVVEQTILSVRVPVGRFGEPSVTIGALRDVQGLHFAAVRVIGLAEGRFPSMPREDPVLPDAVRGALEPGLPTAADRALADLHALDVVVRNAERRVALSAPRMDVERSQREPSSSILEAAAALARPNRATDEPSAVIPDHNALRRDAFGPVREEALRFRRSMPLTESAWQDGVVRRECGFPRRWRDSRALDLDRVRQLSSDDPGTMDGLLDILDPGLPVPGLSPDRPVSPSGIEELLGCPHAFLLRQVLGFEEPAAAPSRHGIGQPAYGQLFHAIAAEFFTRHGPSFSARERTLADWTTLAEEVADRALEEFLEEYPLVGQTLRAQQRQRLRQDVRDLIEYDWSAGGRGRIVACEKTFGRPTPVELQAGERRLYLRGRIDRIDVEGSIALVRDLKTGRPQPRIGKKAGPDPGIDLQIALYGLVAQLHADEWEIPRKIAAAYAYFGRGRGAERSFREDFHETLEPAARHWLALAARLLAERLFPRTPNPGDCEHCCFRPVCGDAAYDRAAAVLAGRDGALADFATLKRERGER